MARINYEKLVHEFSLLEAEQPTRAQGLLPGRGAKFLRESFEAKSLAPSDIDLGRLFEACFGWSAFQQCRNGELATRIMEDQGAIASNAFQQISGQQLFVEFMQSYQSEDYVFTKMIPTKTSPFPLGEKIPGITDPAAGDPYQSVGEQEEFPLLGVSENYIETPDKHTYGRRIAVTRLAIFGDRTGTLLEHVGKAGTVLGINKETRAIDCIQDATPDQSTRYKWRGDVIATYGHNSGTHSFDNLETSNPLTDFNAISAAENLQSQLLDPETGEPITVLSDTIIAAPSLMPTLFRILHSISVTLQAGGFAQTGNLFRTESASPLGKTEFSSNYKPVSSRLWAKRQLSNGGAATDWYMGNIPLAFRWQENWPMRMLTAPPLAQAEFDRDIVVQHRWDERGTFATYDPRYVQKNTA